MNWVEHSFSSWMAAHDGILPVIGWDALKIVLLFIAARVIMSILTRVTRRLLAVRGRLDLRRRETLESLFANVIKYTMYFLWLLTVLPLFGVHIEALLAGAGVAGLAIAFGAQSLIKDVFNGFFILFEDQFGIGDYVTINGVTGRVQSIGLRITQIKVWTGEVEIIPNGLIQQLTNHSKENSIAVVEVNIGYQSDVPKAIAIMKDVMDRLKAEDQNIVGDVSVLGVQAMTDSAITLSAIAECAPFQQAGVVRNAKLRLHDAFRQNGIETPYQKVVYVPDAAAGQGQGGKDRRDPAAGGQTEQGKEQRGE